MGNKMKLILLNTLIVAGAVVTYSPGLLALYPTNPSILLAGTSILLGLGFGAGLIGGNYMLLKGPEKVEHVKQLTSPQIESILREYYHSTYFGTLARTTVDQLHRIETSTERAVAAVKNRFDEGSMSANRYLTIVEAAGATAMDNVKTAAMRIQMFDDNEFKRLKNYKNDNIPDDIQEQQLALYEKNIAQVKGIIAANEKLILKMDTLTLEISDVTADTEEQSDALLQEITELTEELQYYK